MIILGMDTCTGKAMKSPLRDVDGKELCLADPVIVAFKVQSGVGKTEIRFAFANVVYETDTKEWALYSGGLLTTQLTQGYINKYKVRRHRPQDADELFSRARAAENLWE